MIFISFPFYVFFSTVCNIHMSYSPFPCRAKGGDSPLFSSPFGTGVLPEKYLAMVDSLEKWLRAKVCLCWIL